MLATLVGEPPEGDDWIFEPKFDGLRLLASFDGKKLEMISRNAKTQEAFFPDIAAALKKCLRRPSVVDGEVVCIDDQGRTSFRLLQQRFHIQNPLEVAARMKQYPAYYYLFDLLFLNGRDLTEEPLEVRKRLLKTAVKWSDRVRWTAPLETNGAEALHEACRNNEEGVIGKLLSSRYAQRRTKAWIKLKCAAGQEFVVGGFTEPQGSRTGFGALLLGYFEGDRLIYCGKVGTGFSTDTLIDLRQRLDRLAQKPSPFEGGGPPRGYGIHWVRPQMIVEVEFGEWTGDGRLRQPRYRGMRTDKRPRSIRREVAKSVPRNYR